MAGNLGATVGTVELDISDFLTKMGEVEQRVDDLEKASGFGQPIVVTLGDVFEALSNVVDKFKELSVLIYDVGSDFEAAMAQVGATLGMSAEDLSSDIQSFQDLKNAAREMGETTKFTATEAAEALNYLALAGYDAQESIASLPQVLNLAASGGMDLADATSMLVDGIAAMGLGIEDMEYFADRMAKTAQSSNTTVEQLGQATIAIGSTARNLAGDVTELDTVMGLFANNGIKGAEAGRNLRQIMLNLASPTQKAAKYMREIGLEVADLDGNIRPLNDIFRDLDNILQSKGITGSAEIMENLNQIFGARQVRAAQILLSDYGDEWDELYDKIERAEGASSKMAETMQTNLKGSVTIMKSALESLGITIYDGLVTNLTAAVQHITDKIGELQTALRGTQMQDALNRISKAILEMAQRFADLAVDLIPKLIIGLANLLDNWERIVGGIKLAIDAFVAIQAVMLATTVATKGLAAALGVGQLVASLNALVLATGPIGAILLGLAAAFWTTAEAAKAYRNNVESAGKQVYAQQVSTYSALVNEVERYANALDEANRAVDEAKNGQIEEATLLEYNLNYIRQHVDETGKIIDNYYSVKQAIDEVNSIIPNAIQLQDNQITNYGELAESIEDYIEALRQEVLMEAKRGAAKEAILALDEAKKKQDELTESLYKAREATQGAKNDLETYANMTNAAYNQMTQAEKDHYDKLQADWKDYNSKHFINISFESYLSSLADAAQESENIISVAWAENEAVIRTAERTIEDFSEFTEQTAKTTGDNVITQIDNWGDAAASHMATALGKLAPSGGFMHPSPEMQAVVTETLDTFEKLKQDLQNLETQFNLGLIASEEEYHQKRLATLQAYTGEQDYEYSKLYKKEIDYINKSATNTAKAEETKRKEAEKTAQAREKQIEDEYKKQKQALDDRLELEDSYTKDKYLEDWKQLAETLDKESELYKSTIVDIAKFEKKYKEDAQKEAFKDLQNRFKTDASYSQQQYLDDLKAFQDTLDESSDMYETVASEISDVSQDMAEKAFKDWEDGWKNLKKDAESAYKEISKQQDDLEKSLNKGLKLYEAKTKKVKNLTTGLWEDSKEKVYSVKSLQEQAKEIDKYRERLEKLKEKGVSDELIKQVTEMGAEEGSEFAKTLLQMTDKQLESYSESYDKLAQKNKEFAEKYYAEDVEQFKTEFGAKLTAYLETLPDNAKDAGSKIITAFLDGLEDDAGQASGVLGELFATMYESATAKFTKTAGTETGNEAVEGIITETENQEETVKDSYEKLGTAAKDGFLSGFNNLYVEMQNSLTSQIARIVKEVGSAISIPSAGIKGIKVDGTASITPIDTRDTNATVKTAGLTKADIIDAIKQSRPSGDVVLKVDKDKFGTISRDALNNLATKTGEIGLIV